MADCNDPTGPASPELPVTIHVDGNLGAVDFISRLHRGGLEIRQGSDDHFAVIVLSERPPQPVRGIRTTLFEAGAIVESVRLAMSSQSETMDIETVVDRALSAAARLIDNAASQLEGTSNV